MSYIVAVDMRPQLLDCTVAEINYFNYDVIQLFLEINSLQAFKYLPGQYIDLFHPDFGDNAFSIAAAPVGSNLIELHIRLIGDGKFTNFVFNGMQKQDILKISPAKGNLYLRENDSPVIFVAGGSGFSPVKAMVEHMLNINTTRTIHIYWGVGDEVDLYTDLPIEWSKKYHNISFTLVLSEPNLNWQGKTGYVHMAALADFDNLANYQVYACGPPIMVKSVANSFVDKGMRKSDFFADTFEF